MRKSISSRECSPESRFLRIRSTARMRRSERKANKGAEGRQRGWKDVYAGRGSSGDGEKQIPRAENRFRNDTGLRSRAAVEAHFEAVFGAEGDGEEWSDAAVGNKRELKALREGGEEQRGFHHGETGADADARASAERKIRETRKAAAADRIVAPAFGIEAFGIGKETRIAMDDPLEQENVGTSGDAIAVEFEVANGPAANAPSRRVEAHGFLDDHFGVRQARKIGERGSGTAQDGIQFGREGALRVGVLREEIPGPAQSVGGGFVAGEKQRHDFVAKLLVGHAGA